MKKAPQIPKAKKDSSIPPTDKNNEGKNKIKKINLDEIQHAPGYDSSRTRKRTPLPPSGRKENHLESPLIRKQSFQDSCTTSIETVQKSPITERILSSSQLPTLEMPFTTHSNVTSTSQGQMPLAGNIRVVCRFRPLNDKEKNISQNLCVEFIDSQNCTVKSHNENKPSKFCFDNIFNCNCTQQEIYEYSAQPIIDSVLEGFNGTVFAYGQTSSGKTYTMTGMMDSPEKQGIIPRMIQQVFNHIINSSSDIEYTVKVSMIEIYMEKIRDLIDCSKTNLNIREDKDKGIYIEDLTEHYVISEEEVMNLMKIGNDNRSVGSTNMNEHSSRSHSTVIITIHQNNTKDHSAKIGKLYLVDLAGSEKISKTGASGLTLEEAKMINKSLTSLGMVINALTDGRSTHIPYRESKLTRVLQESLGGNAKTSLIITASPSSYNDSETLSTLRFGLRAKNIKNKPKINKDVTVAELKIEIERLETIISKGKKKIDILERFIVKNGLKVPLEQDDEKVSTEIRLNLLEVNLNERALDDEDESRKVVLNEKELKENNYEIEESLKYKQLKEKYDKAENELNVLLDEKALISKRLLETLDLINQINVSIEEQNNCDEQIKTVKFAYEETIGLLKIQIKDMEGIINNKNKRSLFIVIDNISSFEILAKVKPNKYDKIRSYSVENLSRFAILNTNTEDNLTKLNENKYKLIERNENIDHNEEDYLYMKIKIEELYQEKFHSLEKNSEQKNLLYQKMITEKSKLKIDNQFLEKKLKKKDEKIQSLEKVIEETNQQIITLNEKVLFLQMSNSYKSNYSTNVVKVIKGGSRATVKQTNKDNHLSEKENDLIESKEIV